MHQENGKITLVTLRAVSNGALAVAAGGKLPERLKVLGWGENQSVKGLVRLNETSLARLPQRQREMGFDKIALDFEHNTVPGSAEYERTKEPRIVAAYGVPRVIPEDGLYLEGLEWTPQGRESALNFADLSPAVQFDGDGNVVFVHSVALTRNGAVEGLSFFNCNITKECMSEKNNTPGTGNFITLVALAGALGLSATASEADVMNRISLFSSLDERLKKLEDAGKIATLSATDLQPIHERLEKVEQELMEGAEAAQEKERSRVIQLFSAEGKVPKKADGSAYSAEEMAKLPVETLRLLHANTPATVPLSAKGGRPNELKDSGLKGLARAAAVFQLQVSRGS